MDDYFFLWDQNVFSIEIRHFFQHYNIFFKNQIPSFFLAIFLLKLLNAKITSTLTLYMHVPYILPFSENKLLSNG